jgi:hypothetical protein
LCELAQLEELEDKETAATSVVLNPDGTVSFGATDGPLPKSITGTWVMVSFFSKISPYLAYLFCIYCHCVVASIVV